MQKNGKPMGKEDTGEEEQSQTKGNKLARKRRMDRKKNISMDQKV